MTEVAVSPPTNVLEHPRYIGGQEENTETLIRFSQGLAELQSENPEIAGATLFGSRLKGESNPRSDVDCTILIDADQLAAHGVHADVDKKGKVTWGEHRDIKRDFRDHFSQVLAEKTDKDPAVIKDGLYLEPVSDDLIDKQIAAHIDYLRDFDEHTTRYSQWLSAPNASADHRPEEPEYVPLAGGVAALFSPDLLPGLDEYRQHALDTLSQYGEYGEKAWQTIMNRVTFGEGHLDSTDPAYYPVSLEQAILWYGEKTAIGPNVSG